MSNPSDIFRRVEDLAKQNPDKARSLIDALEDQVDQRTGGRFKDRVDQAGDLIAGRLGVSSQQETPPPVQPDAAPQADPAQAQGDESTQA